MNEVEEDELELVRGAEQEALEPPLLPTQDQLNGPEPVTEDAPPVEQRLVFGAPLTAMLLAEPQAPLTTLAVAEKTTVQLAVIAPVVYTPPLQLPWGQVPPTVFESVKPELAVNVKACLFPDVTVCATLGLIVRLESEGVTVKVAGLSGAEQEAVDPPLLPAQDQLKGPDPVTEDAVPIEQRLVLGALLTLVPLALPQVPLTLRGAKQEALVPPLLPEQDQVNGPDPATVEELPEEHRFEFGDETAATPLALPHEPLVAVPPFSGAEHEAIVPPFVPEQVQLKGPAPVTLEELPTAHKFETGAEVVATPSELPQLPLTLRGAEQEALDPPLTPLQDQVNGPDPETLEAVPCEHRSLLGARLMGRPAAGPHEAFTVAIEPSVSELAFVTLVAGEKPLVHPASNRIPAPVLKMKRIASNNLIRPPPTPRACTIDALSSFGVRLKCIEYLYFLWFKLGRPLSTSSNLTWPKT